MNIKEKHMTISTNIQDAWSNIVAVKEYSYPFTKSARSIICKSTCKALIDIFDEILQNNNVVPANHGIYIDIALKTVMKDTTIPGQDWLKDNIDQYIPYLYPEIIMYTRSNEDIHRDATRIYDWLEKYYND